MVVLLHVANAYTDIQIIVVIKRPYSFIYPRCSLTNLQTKNTYNSHWTTSQTNNSQNANFKSKSKQISYCYSNKGMQITVSYCVHQLPNRAQGSVKVNLISCRQYYLPQQTRVQACRLANYNDHVGCALFILL